jgi:hypothetical protein
MIHNFMRRVTKPSRHDPGPGPAGELGVLFDQSPIAMVLRSRELRARRTNATLHRLAAACRTRRSSAAGPQRPTSAWTRP